MTYIITDACIDLKDRSCMAVCPADCIYEGPRSAYINPVECIDCGACIDICPNAAVIQDIDLTDELAPFAFAAEEWVQQHDAEGGAIARGPVAVDHPLIAAFAARDAG
ncbi:ferredoxin family protein [Nocardioides hungaricus]